jgi:hypothetical protein
MSTIRISVGNLYEYDGKVVEIYVIDFPIICYRYQDENNNGRFGSVSILKFMKNANYLRKSDNIYTLNNKCGAY